jgi:hypothetical protein
VRDASERGRSTAFTSRPRRCNFSDGTVTPIDERDSKKFHAVYDSIVDAILKSPEHVPRREPPPP